MRTLRLGLILVLLLLAACQVGPPTPQPTVTFPPPPTARPPVETLPPPAGAGEPAATQKSFLPLLNSSEPATDEQPPAADERPVVTEEQPAAAIVLPVYGGPPLPRAALGVQIHLHREDLDQIVGQLQALGVGWVKVQVSWKLFEPEPGRVDDALFRELDQLVSRATSHDIQVLLSVAKAPDWSRATTEMDGPPVDSAAFAAFMQTLAARYRGNLAAYELWNEPNLQREWMGSPLSAADFVALLRAGAAGVRAADPGALVISGAPATTGINDGVMAIDDRLFLQGMLAAGVGEVVDGVGVHPYGWANPPDATAANPDPAGPTHNNHPSFFFADTLADYRALLDAAGYAALPLWATEFGWGSFAGLGGVPPAGAEFMAYVSEEQQAAYTLRAIELAQQLPGIGPLFLWNLNFAPLLGPGFSEAGYSLLGLDGAPRPVFLAVQAIPRQ